MIDEDVVAIRPSLAIDTAATAQNIAGMRRDFTAWLAADVAAGGLLDDLVLAVYEALANVVDHAYADTSDGTGAVHLTAHRAHDALRVIISDGGRWRTPSEARFRNHGLNLIRLLITQVHVERATSGTVVHLHTDLPPPRRP